LGFCGDARLHLVSACAKPVSALKSPERVVSLLASGTEIVCGLGAGELLVGRSHECDNPAWVRGLPACSSPAFDIDVSSGEIDAEVRRRLTSGESLYHIDTDLINELRPSLLITQAHCDVCAVTPADVKKQGDVVVDNVLALRAGSVQGIYDDIAAVGSALHLTEAAQRLTASIRMRIDAARNAVRHRPAPTVVVLEWTDPVFTMGNWGPELVEAANGRLVLGDVGYSKAISWQGVVDADPEFLIIAPCGFDLSRTAREIPFLERLKGWSGLRAVREGNVALADGNRYFNRSGPTIADTVEMLVEILHGDGDKYRGVAWQRYEGPVPVTHIERLHAEACAKRLNSYTDPATGYEVLTADFLRARGTCCGSGCRHCPYAERSSQPA
jgi:iron complex transport system substrate-binding protein